jgi:hypothetical protein
MTSRRGRVNDVKKKTDVFVELTRESGVTRCTQSRIVTLCCCSMRG